MPVPHYFDYSIVWNQGVWFLQLCSSFSFSFFLFIFLAARWLSLVTANGGYSSLWCVGFSLQWFLLLQSTGSRRKGFSSCDTQDQQLWRTGLVAPRHVGSSRTRARTRVPCIGRWVLNHCATREVPVLFFKIWWSTSVGKVLWKPHDHHLKIILKW